MMPSLRCKPRREVIPDRIENNAIFWFGEMLLALDRGDFRRAFEARAELARLGWRVDGKPRRKAPEAPQTAAGREVEMRPDSHRKPAVDGPGPVRLADAIDPPEEPRPEAKRGPTLPAGFGRPPEARPLRRGRTRSNPTGERSTCRSCPQVKTPRPNGKRSRRLP